MKSTPLNQVKQRFGDKAKLLAALGKLTTEELWIDRVSKQKTLAHVSNTKLIKLHDTLTLVKKDFGSRAKLIDAILKLDKRSKDGGYKSRLEGYPTPRLVDLHHSVNRAQASRAAGEKAKAEAQAPKGKAEAQPVPKRRARSKKAQAKARS